MELQTAEPVEPKEMTALLQLALVNVINNWLRSIITLIDCSQSLFSVRSLRSSTHDHLHWRCFCSWIQIYRQGGPLGAQTVPLPLSSSR